MPRANRYIVPGYAYHLTHRCHNRDFLFKFAIDRQRYRTRLREALSQCQVALLTYNITRNHAHLLAYAEDTTALATMMQQAAGELARDYNRRKNRTGAFWEGRYHATMVDSGRYLWECLHYVELNMVRCGVVSHPSQWEWSGYGELMGLRKRNRLLNLDKLLELTGAGSVNEFRSHFLRGIEERIEKDLMRRQPRWTQALAVGSKSFVEAMKGRIHHRQFLESVEDGGAWVLREDYGATFGSENRPIGLLGGCEKLELPTMPASEARLRPTSAFNFMKRPAPFSPSPPAPRSVESLKPEGREPAEDLIC